MASAPASPARRRSARRPLEVVALLGLCLAASAAARPAPQEAEQVRAGVVAWLERNEQDVPVPAPADWGERELSILVELLGETADPASPRAGLLTAALMGLRPAAGPWLRRNVTSAAPVTLRVGALRACAALGTVRESVLCAELVPAADAERAGVEVRRALAAILQRDERARGELWAVYESASPPLRPYVVDAVGDVPLRSSLTDLGTWIEHFDAPRLHVLRAIERIAAACAPPFAPELCAAVCAELESEDPERRSAAAKALGALEDEQAIPRLIELLEDEDSDVRSRSHDALRSISGCAFRGDPARWMSWHALESAWWRQRAPAVLALLREGDEAALLAAINELVGRSLGRHRIAAQLVPLLEDEHEGVRRLALAALVQLRSPVPVPALERLLEEEQEGPFKDAVQSALLAIRESRPGRGVEHR